MSSDVLVRSARCLRVRNLRLAGSEGDTASARRNGTCGSTCTVSEANITKITGSGKAMSRVMLGSLCVRSMAKGICGGRVAGNNVCFVITGPAGRNRAKVTECGSIRVEGYSLGGMGH